MNVISLVFASALLFSACGVEQGSKVETLSDNTVASIDTITEIQSEVTEVAGATDDTTNIISNENNEGNVDIAEVADVPEEVETTAISIEEPVESQVELNVETSESEEVVENVLPYVAADSYDFDSIVSVTDSVGITENELNAMVTNLVANYSSGTMMNVSYDYVSSITDWYSYYQIVMRNTVQFVAFNIEGHKYLLLGVQDSDGSADNWYYFIDVTKGIELGSAGFEKQDFSLCEDRYFTFVTNTKCSDGYNQQIIDLLSGEIVYDELSENLGYLNQIYGMSSIVKF